MDRRRKAGIRRDAARSASLILENYLECDTDRPYDDDAESDEFRAEIRRIASHLHSRSLGTRRS